jgi:ABC-type proline/glycine betaine transport system ATPase subunit
VYQNVAFGLEVRKVARAETRERVARVLELVNLSGLEGRYPGQLSGGQQQRVALARSLVVEPAILLLDEPLSNLDAKLRERMRFEIRQLHERLGITSIYVTHDQQEAMVIADRVVLLNDGKILLANLSTGLLTEEIAGMFGSFLVTKIINAAFRRTAIPEAKRRPFYLYVDEFQAFMNVSVGFDRILNESRKFRLIMAGLANQYVGQLSQEVRQAIMGNVGTMVVFRLGVEDAQTIARQLGVFTADEILNLAVGQAIVRAEVSSATFNVQTYPAPPVEPSDPTNTIRSRSRSQFARPRAEVEAMLRGPTPIQKKPHPKPGSKGQAPSDPNEDDLIN